jgi:sialate O-acetylesterase
MKSLFNQNFFVLTILLTIVSISANVKMPNAFSNSMVLQQKCNVRIWGSASNDEAITVQFNNQSKSVVAKSGSWSVLLDSMNAGGPYTLTIKGLNTVTISDVYVGEVWQCAGQSNMDTRVSYYPQYNTIMNSTKLPMLRYLTIRQPGNVTNNVWEKCTTADKIGKLSCLGFFFGKEILNALKNDIAVGLIVTAVGGTTVASWIDPQTISDNPDIRKIDSTAAGMYSEWVKPVEGYAIRGTLWMQGEQDRSNGLHKYYQERLVQVISGWRKCWNIGHFPFYIIQLANYGTVQTDPNESATSAAIREAQRLGLAIDNTTLTVLIDLGDSLHFGNKQEAGRRLALPARALEYGEKDLVYSGPLFIQKIVDGSKIHCRFIHCGNGMKAKSGTKLTGFAIAGSNNSYSWADAVVHGDTVTVSSSSVSKPVNVHYAYGANPIGNLINAEGLPASPFTTDGPQLPLDTFKTSVSQQKEHLSENGVYVRNNTLVVNSQYANTSFHLFLFSLNGKLIYNKLYSPVSDCRSIEFHLRGIKSGSYFVRIQNSRKVLTSKISVMY